MGTCDAVQKIWVPPACPDCGGQICVTGVGTAEAIVHCHDWLAGTDCGWRMPVAFDPQANSYTVISGWTEGGR